MALAKERLRILELVESGQVTAQEGARLLEALGTDNGSRERTSSSTLPRSLRVRVTDTTNNRLKVNVTIPVGLVNIGLKLGARLAPQNTSAAIENILRAVENGVTGRVYELQDLEEGERIEVFVE